jgi:hypothetical protein
MRDQKKLPFHVIIEMMGMIKENSLKSQTSFNFGIGFGNG